jgi:hypothetical protein
MLVSGFKANFYQANGCILMELISKASSKTTNQKAQVIGSSAMAT